MFFLCNKVLVGLELLIKTRCKRKAERSSVSSLQVQKLFKYLFFSFFFHRSRSGANFFRLFSAIILICSTHIFQISFHSFSVTSIRFRLSVCFYNGLLYILLYLFLLSINSYFYFVTLFLTFFFPCSIF